MKLTVLRSSVHNKESLANGTSDEESAEISRPETVQECKAMGSKVSDLEATVGIENQRRFHVQKLFRVGEKYEECKAMGSKVSDLEATVGTENRGLDYKSSFPCEDR
ncbi:hypothetical protein F3Y22_tig00116958pilonHSYRG00021 [Hibiscus syriacus]|uniref:Uncharacterized protein n=1 Tax=Hibiscus syriacus TaxID=106335 RepID=A0A6A2XNW2_HIBSY|nr:hypothetical protein F3Y22_tig00116958pilonHSYRG00021 [Hibiscus syriacus]